MITIVGATHPGIREHNEDCFAADSNQGIGLIADGMGGYACGEVASALVKQTVVSALNNNEGLKEAIARAHRVVKAEASRDSRKQGMGSTVIALKFVGADYDIAWVGDSRAYLWDGALKQISRDHSYVESLLAAGAITEAQAINHPNRNLVTQAIGVTNDHGLQISLVRGRMGRGQQLLLCSDGLVDELTDTDIADIMAKASSAKEAVNSLIEAAVGAGGHDNITVLIASTDDDGVQRAIVPEVVRTTYVSSDQSGQQCERHDFDQSVESTPTNRHAGGLVAALINFFSFTQRR